MNIERDPSFDPTKKCPTNANLDVVGVGAKAKNLEWRSWFRQGQRLHPAYSAAARQASVSRRFQGIRPCSTISSSVCRSRSVSMDRQKPLCL